jgi:hypothetical protein
LPPFQTIAAAPSDSTAIAGLEPMKVPLRPISNGPPKRPPLGR